jgi:UDP-glucose 4-epimerase
MAGRLLQLGNAVTIIDDLSTGSRDNVPTRAEFILGDVANPRDLRRAFAQPLDAVFHIAGQASTIKSFHDPDDDLRVNLHGTIDVVRHCLEFRVPRMLYASSMTVYGHPLQIPTPETELCKPISYYGISKYAAERFVHATASRPDLQSPFNVTSFRMFNVYGEGQSLTNPYQGVMAIFIGQVLRGEPITIHSDGEQSRDFVHIDDVVDAWLAALDNPAAHNETFNLGEGINRSINRLVAETLRSVGKDWNAYPIAYGPERPGDQRHMAADISKIRRVLKWSPRVKFEDGMQRVVDWARAETRVPALVGK